MSRPKENPMLLRKLSTNGREVLLLTVYGPISQGKLTPELFLKLKMFSSLIVSLFLISSKEKILAVKNARRTYGYCTKPYSLITI